MNEHLRILLANEPLAYREALADAFQEHRPHLEVLLVEPQALDLGAVTPGGDVVVCSRLTRTVLADALAWVRLYPEGVPLAEVGIAGRRETLPEVDFPALLTVVDRAECLRQIA